MLERAREALRQLVADTLLSPGRLVELGGARSNHAFAVLDLHDTPIAALKLSDNPTKLIPERHALALLHDNPATPNVLAHAPGALLLSWIPDATLEPARSLDHIDTHAARALGDLLGTLHTTCPPARCELKLLHDPLPLARRLSKIAHKAVKRARKHLTEPDVVRLQSGLERLDELLAAHSDALSVKRLVHRDLNPQNIIVSERGGDLLGLVDFERAAAAPPAWDFVKLRWWIFDLLPTPCWEAFISAYRTHSAPPAEDLVRLFELFESLTMLAYFAHSPQSYAAQARACLDGVTRE